MHARAVFCFWIALLSMTALVVSSPVPEPEPVPIDPLSAVHGSNLNLGCQNGCSAAGSAQLNTNAALGSATSPLSLLGGFVLAGSILAAV